MGILNIYEVTSLVFWIRSDVMELFRSWRHGYFEYSCDIVIFNIQNYVVFWIFIVMTSLQEYSKYYEYSKYPLRQLLIFPWRHFMNIQNTHGVSLWIFKLHMTSLHAYSKYPWRHFWKFKIPMTSAWIFIKLPLTSPHEVTSWVFKTPITSLHEFSKYPWRIFKLPMRHFEYSQSDVMGILEYSWSDGNGYFENSN